MSNIFVPFSPYHLLLCYAIAAERPTEENIMLLAGDYFSMISACQIFQKIFHDAPFRVITLCSGERVGNLQKFLQNKRRLKKIKSVVDTITTIDNLYYFCEWSINTTYILHLLTELSPRPSFHFVEDGIATYVEKELKTKNVFEKLADAIVYGKWHSSCRIQGMLNPDAYVHAIRPNLLPCTFEKSKKIQIGESSLINHMDMNNLPNEIKEIWKNKKVDVLIALDSQDSHSSDAYILLILDIIREALQNGQTVAIKRHPVDIENSNLTKMLCISDKVIELPAYLPVELYYCAFYSTLKRVIGGLGTAIFTARWLMPRIEILSVVSSVELPTVSNAEKTLEIFKKVNIIVKVI